MSYAEKIILTGTNPQLDAQFGTSVAVDGYYMAVGVPLHNRGFGVDSGFVFVYKRNTADEWEFQQSFVTDSFAANDYFGYSVAIYRDYIVVGAYGTSSSQGSAYLFKRLGDVWTQKAIITETDGAASYEFGRSVDIYNNYIIVGSPKHSSGYTEIFKINGDDTVTSIEVLSILNANTGDNFGCSVSIDNDYVVIGAEGENSSTGAAYTYKKNENIETLWEEQSRLVSSDGEKSDNFGCAVSISNEYSIIGAKNKISISGDQYGGAAYIFQRTTAELWHELKKLIPSVESIGYETNYFGSSVNIRDDYIIVGSPGAQGNKGIADIYYRKSSWDNIQKLSASNGAIDDEFGSSVAIYDLFVIIGSPLADPSSKDNAGSAYIFENPISKLKLAQQFYTSHVANPSVADPDMYVPSKASIYLNRIGGQSINYILLKENETVIDATNFSTLDQVNNKVIFDDRTGNFTGNGYMILAPEPQLTIDKNSDEDFSIINYPIKANKVNTFHLWIRCLSSSTDNPSFDFFKADLLLDNIVIHTFNDIVSINEWNWIYAKVIIPDTQEHVLGIRMKEKNCAIDKLYFDTNYYEPDVIGPLYTESTYITLHMKMYESDQSIYPSYPLFVYDYKTSIDEVIQDDWYNFNIKILDTRMGYNEPQYFDSDYFLVLAVTGMNDKNFIIWQQVDNDEYRSLPSMIKV